MKGANAAAVTIMTMAASCTSRCAWKAPAHRILSDLCPSRGLQGFTFAIEAGSSKEIYDEGRGQIDKYMLEVE